MKKEMYLQRELSEKVKKGVNQFLNEYYDRYTGLYLKSRGFLKDLNELEKR